MTTEKTTVVKGDDDAGKFLDEFRASLEQESFAKLVLGAYQGPEAGLVKMIIRPVVIRKKKQLCCLYHYQTKDITKNIPVEAGAETVLGVLGAAFKMAHLFTATEEIHLKIDRQGVSRLSRAKSIQRDAVSVEHDRQKHRRLNPRRPFLQALGITDSNHAVLPSMSHKWKQINRFLEVFDHVFSASELAGRKQIRVVDFGAGKGYLTFAIHDYLRVVRGVEVQVTGVELRPELVKFCNEVAGKLKCEGLTFSQGSLADHAGMDMDVLIALHACDTATDMALHRGIRAGASLLLCAPCCHKEIRPQMTAPEILLPVLRYGVHLGQEAEMVTDSLRALLLESAGYQVGVFEFISLEHTDKNKMISAVKRSAAVDRDKVMEQVEALKAFYGIRGQELETLMREGFRVQGSGWDCKQGKEEPKQEGDFRRQESE